ncbi:MAG: hypothetical protein ACXW3Z_14995 [Limisphaerales bacterium]
MTASTGLSSNAVGEFDVSIRRGERSCAPNLFVLNDYRFNRTILKIQAELQTCELPGLSYDVHLTAQENHEPCLFIRYAFDHLPDNCRFGPAGRHIRETLLESGLASLDANGVDLVCGDYRICIGAVHSSMLASCG